MEYEGNLYGRVRGRFILLDMTAKDVDELEKENAKLKKLLIDEQSSQKE